jgi:hypothetical protein
MKIITLGFSLLQALLIYYSIELFERAKETIGFTSIGPDIMVYYYILSILGVIIGSWVALYKRQGDLLGELCLILSLISFISFVYLQASGIVGYYQKPE